MPQRRRSWPSGAVLVEHYQRLPDGSWRYLVAGPGESITLDNGARLDVDALYDGVFELPGDEDETPAVDA